jgi:hypothetical protein
MPVSLSVKVLLALLLADLIELLLYQQLLQAMLVLHYTIKKLDSGSGNVVVTRAGDDTIDGGTTVVLYHQHESVTVIVGAADTWYIM